MANPAVDAILAAVSAATSVDDSAIAFITGVPALITAAVAAAVANGATAEELAPVSQAALDLQAKSDALVAALTANTPVTPQQAKAKKA